jgi:hypothetical protein
MQIFVWNSLRQVVGKQDAFPTFSWFHHATRAKPVVENVGAIECLATF